MTKQNQQVAVKNLLSINDILGAEKLYYEKLDTYIGMVKDPALKTMLSDFKKGSESHYNAVYNYLKSHQA